MSSSKEYLNFILERLKELEDITYRPMMGEYIIYYRSKIIAYICDDRFLVKNIHAARNLMPNAPLEVPYSGAKEMLLVLDVDDSHFLRHLFESMYEELPFSKQKKNKKSI